MIELVWQDYSCDDKRIMMWMTNLLSWFTSLITFNEEYKHLAIDGYIVLKAIDGVITSIIVCSDKNRNELLKIIQQPPELYKGKYIAKISVDEEEDQTQQSVDLGKATWQKNEPECVKEVLPPPPQSSTPKTASVKYIDGVWTYVEENDGDDDTGDMIDLIEEEKPS